MSAETFTTAMFLITAIIAAGVLINAVFPVVYTMASTFSSSTHSADVRMRTDFVIVTTFAPASSSQYSDSGQIWMKNIGTQQISTNDIQSSDVFFGPVNSFSHLRYPTGWSYTITGNTNSGYWGPGDTLEIDILGSSSLGSGTPVYFQFVLPNGVWRSTQFNTAGS